MRVAVIGSNGQLGTDICRAFEAADAQVFHLTHADIEIASRLSVQTALQSIEPELIVNTAAAHNVDRCESTPTEAFSVNALGARHLALFARDQNSCLVHISTDYVFDGNKESPYRECDLARPLNAYGTSKLAGEHFIQAIAPRHFILRVAGLYGHAPCRAKGGVNFVEKMIALAHENAHIRVVADEFTTPTCTAEVAKQLLRLVTTRQYGLYHATAEGACSWFEFATAIFEFQGMRPSLESCSSRDYPGTPRRPRYSVLDNAELKRLQLNTLSHWRDGLEGYLSSRCSRSAVLVG